LLALPALAVRYTQNARHSPDNQHAMRIWLVAGIAGMVFIAFTTLLFFIGITMRYLLDFLPLTMILANIGLWSALELTKDRPHARTALYIVTGVLFVYSIIIGLLLGTTGYLYPPSF
jgi:hypothetical protein